MRGKTIHFRKPGAKPAGYIDAKRVDATTEADIAAQHALAPLLRDQHYNQLKEAVRLRVSSEATEWQARNPQQMNCKFKNCI